MRAFERSFQDGTKSGVIGEPRHAAHSEVVIPSLFQDDSNAVGNGQSGGSRPPVAFGEVTIGSQRFGGENEIDREQVVESNHRVRGGVPTATSVGVEVRTSSGRSDADAASYNSGAVRALAEQEESITGRDLQGVSGRPLHLDDLAALGAFDVPRECVPAPAFGIPRQQIRRHSERSNESATRSTDNRIEMRAFSRHPRFASEKTDTSCT